MEEENKVEKEILTCELCGTYKGDKRQMNMHKIHCGKPSRAEEAPETTTPKRKERIPFGVPRRRLNAPDNDGYHYRVFNDNWRKEPGRIQRALDAGYEAVENFDSLTVGTNEDGSEIKGVLMRIPEELYKADQKLKQQEVDKVDKAIKTGKLEEQANDKRYIPQGIKIWANNNENP